MLTDEQKERVAYLLDENKPQLYGYDVWNGLTMSAHILIEFNKLSVRSCQYLFHKLGFSHIRGLMHSGWPNRLHEDRYRSKEEGDDERTRLPLGGGSPNTDDDLAMTTIVAALQGKK